MCCKEVISRCLPVSLLLHGQYIFAAENNPAMSSPLASSGLGHMIAGLILVLIIIFFLTWVVRRVPGFQQIGQGAIRIIDSQHISQRERILLVEINQQQLLLGVTSQNINTLHVLSEPIVRNREQTEMADRLVNLFSVKKDKSQHE